MTNSEYIAGVLKTEAPITDELLTRANDTWTQLTLSQAFDDVLSVCDQMSMLKRLIFYNKIPPGGKPNHPPSSIPTPIGVRNARFIHAVAGLQTEVGEIVDALDKDIFHFKKEPLDEVNLIEEVGDLFWYLALFCSVLGVTFEDVMERNNRKLRARYGNKFSEEAAVVRDLETERRELESSESSTFTLDDFRQITQRPAWKVAWQAVYRRDPPAEFGEFLPVDLPLLTRVAVAIEAASEKGVIPV